MHGHADIYEISLVFFLYMWTTNKVVVVVVLNMKR